MKRNVMAAIVVIAAAVTAWAQESDCPEWWDGGTLFQADNKEWTEGTNRDRLATAAVWAFQYIEDMSPSIETIDELFWFAVQIRDCADTGVDGISVKLSMSQVATFCLVRMKDSFQQRLDLLDAARKLGS